MRIFPFQVWDFDICVRTLCIYNIFSVGCIFQYSNIEYGTRIIILTLYFFYDNIL